MAVFQEPTQWDHELGNNADVSSLPDDTSATSGVASLQKLFQLINQTPLEAGGVAPDREDFNALFKYLGDQIFYTQNGGVPSYNADYGYIAGRVVLYNGNIYKCLQANDSSDPKDPTNTAYWGLLLTSGEISGFANTDLSNLSVTGQAVIDGKADTDLSNVPSSKGILVESYVNGDSWYKVYSDGFCIQGGVALSGSTSVSLLKNYLNTNYSVLSQYVPSAITTTYHSIISNKTTSGFSVAEGQYSYQTKLTNPCVWVTFGYIS